MSGQVTFRGASRRKLVTTSIVGTVLLGAASAAFAKEVTAGGTGQTPASLTLGEIFLFWFLTLGPFNVLGPFSSMTRGRDNVFKRRLALEGTGIAAIALPRLPRLAR
jgi:hypothetical protein